MPTGGDDTQATVAGLQPFTNYDCSVSANTSVGEGPPSSVLIERTVEAGEGKKYQQFSVNSLGEIYMLHTRKISGWA